MSAGRSDEIEVGGCGGRRRQEGSARAGLGLAAASASSSSAGRGLFAAVSLLLTPSVSMAYARAGMLSATGRCRAFDSAANGYVRSEAVGVARSGRAPAKIHLRDLAETWPRSGRDLAEIRPRSACEIWPTSPMASLSAVSPSPSLPTRAVARLDGLAGSLAVGGFADGFAVGRLAVA